MAFSPWNIVGCLLKKGLQGRVMGTLGPPLAMPLYIVQPRSNFEMPLESNMKNSQTLKVLLQCPRSTTYREEGWFRGLWLGSLRSWWEWGPNRFRAQVHGKKPKKFLPAMQASGWVIR